MREYTLRRSRKSSRISIQVRGNASIWVTAPPLIPKLLIEIFLKKQECWIQQQITKQQKRVAVETAESIQLFGKTYMKDTTNKEKEKTGFTIVDGKLVYNNALAMVTLSEPQYIQAVARFLKQTAEQYILPKTHSLAKTMQINFSHITLREQRSRWGSCSTRGTLNFNWRLVHFSPQVIDYVLIHELAHITHHNHSASFWALVAKYAPTYERSKKILEKFSIPLG